MNRDLKKLVLIIAGAAFLFCIVGYVWDKPTPEELFAYSRPFHSMCRGWSKDEVISTVGRPTYHRNSTSYDSLLGRWIETSEWHYKYGVRIFFENGRLDSSSGLKSAKEENEDAHRKNRIARKEWNERMKAKGYTDLVLGDINLDDTAEINRETVKVNKFKKIEAERDSHRN